MTSGADAYCTECNSLLFPDRSHKNAHRRLLLSGVLAGFILVAIIAVVSWSKLRAGSGLPPPQPPSQAPSTTPAPLAKVPPLRLCGSSVMGDRLASLLAQGFALRRNGTPPPSIATPSTPSTVASTSIAPSTVTPTNAALAANELVSIDAVGTSTGFELLATRKCDIAMASRQISPAERGRLRFLGDMTSPSAEHVIGLDGIVIIVNRANRVSTLSIPEIRRIFAGNVNDWSVVHGAPGRINVYAPTINTGTIDSLKLLVMGHVPFATDVRHVRTVADVARAVARDPYGVGFVALPYATGVKPLPVNFATQRLAPDQVSVGRETYPLSRRLYLYSAARMSPVVRAFIDYAQSDEGQLNIDRAGFVGSTKRLPPTSRRVPAGAPPGYARLVRTTQQSEFVFYFKTGSDTLDNKALIDIGRLVQAMHEPGNRDQEIILAGFADSTGSHERNKDLSLARARSVQRQLTGRHVIVKDALGFGDAMPIRDNSTPEGREKNRRVEIFVTFKPS